jgi:hypothetical protein
VGGVAPDLPIWAQWFAALAVPIAAIVGIGLGIENFKLAMRRRNDELFERRYQLYFDFRKDLIEAIKERYLDDSPTNQNKYQDILDFHALKCSFVFEKSVSSFICGLREEEIEDWFKYYEKPGDMIAEAFARHLRFR